MRVGISLAFFFSYYSNLEYFPTDFVSTSFAACNFVARIAAVLAPFTVEVFSEPLMLVVGFSLLMALMLMGLEKEDEEETKTVHMNMKL